MALLGAFPAAQRIRILFIPRSLTAHSQRWRTTGHYTTALIFGDQPITDLGAMINIIGDDKPHQSAQFVALADNKDDVPISIGKSQLFI